MLKDDDKRKMRDLNGKNEYGLTYNQLLRLVNKHEKARKENDLYTMELIEYRLTDINFHYECGMLMDSNYKELRKEIKEAY